jgi:ligand-binding sensor domain-containing protein
LDFQLSGTTNNVQHTLLQKRDGSFWLALFQEAVSYDPKTRADLEVPVQSITLKLPWTSPELRVFRPNSGAEPTARIAGASQVALQVPDEVLLVEIKPP